MHHHRHAYTDPNGRLRLYLTSASEKNTQVVGVAVGDERQTLLRCLLAHDAVSSMLRRPGRGIWSNTKAARMAVRHPGSRAAGDPEELEGVGLEEQGREEEARAALERTPSGQQQHHRAEAPVTTRSRQTAR